MQTATAKRLNMEAKNLAVSLGWRDKNWSTGPAREKALTYTSGIQLKLQKGYALGEKKQSRKRLAFMESKCCVHLLSAVQKKSKPFPKVDNTIQCCYNFICSIEYSIKNY